MADDLGFVAQLTDYQSKSVLAAPTETKKVQGITIKSGKSLIAGTPLGRITATGKYTVFNPAGNDGTENLAGILVADIDATSEDKLGEMYVVGEFNKSAVDVAITFAGVTSFDLLTLNGSDTHGIFNNGNILIREDV